MKKYQILFSILILFLISCDSSDPEEMLSDEFDEEYNGVSTDEFESINGVWRIEIDGGIITGTTSYIEQGEVFETDLTGTVNASGEFNMTVDFGGGFTSTISGIVLKSGVVAGIWIDSEGERGEINGKFFEDDYDTFNAKYGGTADNSEYTWEFEIRNGIIEGSFGSAKLLTYIDSKGTNVKVVNTFFSLAGLDVKVLFAILADGDVEGVWVDVNDPFIGGEIRGEQTSFND